jgi:hypothetical protein
MTVGAAWLLFVMIGVHAVCDYPLQGDFLAHGKAGGTLALDRLRYLFLLTHAWIHAAAVALLTGSLALGAIELVLHTLIDELKIEGHTSLWTDQALHVACKMLYVALLALGVSWV